MYADVVVEARDLVGESPVWCERTQTLWWVDVRQPAVQSFMPNAGRHVRFPLTQGMAVAGLVLHENGSLLLCTSRGILAFSPPDKLMPLIDPEASRPGVRLNEARCDAKGRLWCGSMLDTDREAIGTLFRIDPDGTLTEHLHQLDIPNGIAWSPDNSVMYFADSTRQLIFSCDFDLERGNIENQYIFADLKHTSAWPDGAVIDQDGCLWSAQLYEGKVIRFAPDGRVVGEIRLPTTLPTSCAFGGSDLKTLYITTGSKRLTDEQRAEQPLAGALFAVELPVGGFADMRYAGRINGN
ncbi:SMP-30/gluconolactonase/LRE family protein [Pseudorhodoplanes sp.]|uniref:SMP-30/gluconolactonase/LRE family protein n=1 Tax=Pseudorhodoplanes sp. TaxID=1934341 RepID=UPI003D14057D